MSSNLNHSAAEDANRSKQIPIKNFLSNLSLLQQLFSYIVHHRILKCRACTDIWMITREAKEMPAGISESFLNPLLSSFGATCVDQRG